MEAIALAPAIVALAVCLVASPARAFLGVFLPLLLLVPTGLAWKLPGLPDLGFQQAAILPIAVMLLFSPSTRWRWSPCDGLVGLLLALVLLSEYRAKGMADVADLSVDLVGLALLPYVVGKILITQPGFAERLAKHAVVLLFGVCLLSVWHFRMGSAPFFRDFWLALFPDAWIPRTDYRWGYARITGPYGHAILAGIVLGVGFLLQLWLHVSRRWRSQAVSWILLAGLAGGVLMTMSRGPWIGLLLGLCVAAIGFARRRQLVLGGALGVLVLVGLVGAALAGTYAAVERADAESRLQENAAYRVELIDGYVPVILDEPLLGWSRSLWPVQPRLPSVDNHYILLALEHGLLSLASFLLLLAWVAVRLVRTGMRATPGSARAQLAFVLLGGLTCIVVSIATVWLGNQTEPLLFLLAGCSEGFLLARRPGPAAAPARPMRPTPTHALPRVLT